MADAGGKAVRGRVVGLAVVGEGLGAEVVGDAVDLCLGDTVLAGGLFSCCRGRTYMREATYWQGR